MPIVQTAAPAVEPVTRAEAKVFLRLDSDLTADDSLIDTLIEAARRYGESYCNRSFIQQSWRLVLDAFPCQPWGIRLERGPVSAVTTVKYLDMGGTLQTMPSTDYATDLVAPEPRITPVFGKIWPIALPQIGAVQVDYVAGYGAAAANVPAGIKSWMLMRVATLYRNREEVAILGRGKVDPLPFVDALLDPYRVVQA